MVLCVELFVFVLFLLSIKKKRKAVCYTFDLRKLTYFALLYLAKSLCKSWKSNKANNLKSESESLSVKILGLCPQPDITQRKRIISFLNKAIKDEVDKIE